MNNNSARIGTVKDIRDRQKSNKQRRGKNIEGLMETFPKS